MRAGNTRQKVLANNIANIDTPGFQPKEVVFARLLANATSQKSALLVKPQVVAGPSNALRNDGSGVSPEQQFMAVAKNQAYMNAMGQGYLRVVHQIENVSTGGRLG